MKKGLLAIVLFSCSLSVHAKTPLGKDIDAALALCKNAASATQDISDCYQTAMKAWDAELNKQYKSLLKDQSEVAQAKLKIAQRGWVKYKDDYFLAINAFYQQEQGTVWGLVAAETKLNVIKEKAIDLDRLRRSTDLSGE
ncbi:lysozyme inhibitor LprI family protein [Hafnia alvei]|uniref:lysozyme inhibitor LprI family protein n=1 Tax=Hafnia alvei TaxID=569 RepID=UPI00345D13C8